MTKEEAIVILKNISWQMGSVEREQNIEAFRMAIEALQTKVVWCKDCKYQDECEEVVLFDINDDEVMGHRIHWCSYGRSEK